jgi:hypothetical protein
VTVGDHEIQNSGYFATIDTGTSFIKVPGDDFDQIRAVLEGTGKECELDGQGRLACNCSPFSSVKDLFPSI